MFNTAEDRTIKVYVRKGADNQERWLSFRIPDRVKASTLLPLGIAIDGNQAMFAVQQRAGMIVMPEWLLVFLLPSDPARTTDDQSTEAAPTTRARPTSLPEALALVQRGLVGWFGSLGYDVEFA